MTRPSRGHLLAARSSTALVALAMIAMLDSATALAQNKPRPAAPPRQSNSLQIGGYAMFGNISFTAAESFDAVVGSPSGPIFGGGARVGLPIGGLFVDAGAWRYRADGERVFVDGDEVFRLGIPVEITVTPIEISAGWRFRIRQAPKFSPYAAGGLTILRYQETSDFATESENVDDTFNGFHVLGGAEYKLTRWLGVAGEAAWSTVPDALGEAGVSAAYDETDLGGMSFRFKVTIGR